MEKEKHLTSRGTENETMNPKLMSRDNFLKRIIRLGLLALLAVISIVLSGRISPDKCSGCPGNGRCNGETDCNKY